MGAMNVVLVTFASLRHASGSLAHEAIGIAQELHRRGRLRGVICLDFDAEVVGVPTDTISSPPHSTVQKIVSRLLETGGRALGWQTRRMREEFFDLCVSRSSALRGADAILFLKPAFPKTVAEAARLGVPSFAWASILHPDLNREGIELEQQRWGVVGGTDYTDERRTTNLRRFFETIDSILVGSDVARRSYVDRSIAADRVHLLRDTFGVDCDRFTPGNENRPETTFRALHLSNLNLIKGIGYLLEAWKELNLEDAQLILAGGAEDSIVELAHRIDPPATRFLGHVDDTVSAYRSADVFISPSVADLNPYTVLEAMASGTPVIVSDRCGMSEAVDEGVTGFVYRHDDVETLKARIQWCHENRVALREMGRAARSKATRYRRDRFASVIVEALEQLSD